MRTRSRALIMAVAVMGLVSGAPAIANADASEGSPCSVGNINNGFVWSGFNANHTGNARFYEYGDRLEVIDTSSNGERARAHFQFCTRDDEGNAYYARYSWLDSGPDEGKIDRQLYDLSFSEGVKVRFKVCDGYDECGPWQYANA